MSDLIQFDSEQSLGHLIQAQEDARQFLLNSKAPATVRAYRAAWERFTTWCQTNSQDPLPASEATLALYLAEAAKTLKVSTLVKHVAAISEAHQMAGHQSPTKTALIRQLMSGIRRTKGTAQTGKAPVLTADLRAMVLSLPDTLIGLRNKALLLIGFAGAFRRSEMVALDVRDLAFAPEGLRITIRRSKTDQDGQGAVIGIPYGRGITCPVTALKSWLEAASIAEGPVFRPIRKGAKVQVRRLTDQVVATVIKETASSIGMDASTLSGHSLRVGLVTQAAMMGLSDRSIMAQTRHRSRAMVDRYVRDINIFRDNAAGSIGL